MPFALFAKTIPAHWTLSVFIAPPWVLIAAEVLCWVIFHEISFKTNDRYFMDTNKTHETLYITFESLWTDFTQLPLQMPFFPFGWGYLTTEKKRLPILFFRWPAAATAAFAARVCVSSDRWSKPRALWAACQHALCGKIQGCTARLSQGVLTHLSTPKQKQYQTGEEKTSKDGKLNWPCVEAFSHGWAN